MPQGKRLLDLGFHVCHEVSKTKKVTLAKKPSYTYRARVARVVDGDTIIAVMSLGFGTKLRGRSCFIAFEKTRPFVPKGTHSARNHCA